MFKRHRTTCPKYDKYSMSDSPQNWGRPRRPFNEHEYPHSNGEQIIHIRSENDEDNGYGLNLDLQTIVY